MKTGVTSTILTIELSTPPPCDDPDDLDFEPDDLDHDLILNGFVVTLSRQMEGFVLRPWHTLCIMAQALLPLMEEPMVMPTCMHDQ